MIGVDLISQIRLDGVPGFVKVRRDERARIPVQASVTTSFAPGVAYQFDGSHETITLVCR